MRNGQRQSSFCFKIIRARRDGILWCWIMLIESRSLVASIGLNFALLTTSTNSIHLDGELSGLTNLLFLWEVGAAAQKLLWQLGREGSQMLFSNVSKECSAHFHDLKKLIVISIVFGHNSLGVTMILIPLFLKTNCLVLLVLLLEIILFYSSIPRYVSLRCNVLRCQKLLMLCFQQWLRRAINFLLAE